MTETARRLRRLGAPHARARALAVVLGGLGAALAAAALGLALSPAVSGVTLGWVLIVASAGAAAWAVLRTRHEAGAPALGRLIESAAGGRAGSIVGVVSPTAGKGTGSSAALLLAADTRAAAVVSFAAPDVASAMRRTTLRRISYGTGAAVTGVLLFLAGSPASGRAAAFWHPLRTWRDARAPVRLVVDQRTVRRGGSVTATITVPGAVRVTLWTRGPGEPWKPQLLALDANGSVVQHVGPIESDLYLRATSGGRGTAELKIDVALPAFLADLGLTARFPSYLNRSDEPLLVGPDVIPLPAGTTVLTSGSASVPLASAAWTLESRVEPLHIAGTRIDGRFTPPASGTWRLRALSADGSALEGVAPELHLLIVPDSAPIVMLPVPGRDTTLPISLHQQLVADIRDDHGITRAYVVSWRVSRTGRVGEAVRESLDVSGVGDRAIVQGRLDAEQRGLLPGDTLRLYVEAFDNAPTPHSGRSAEIALRLPSMEELRAQAREAARAVASAADSVSAAQRELSDRTRDLAQERSRDPDGRPAGRPDGRAGTQQNGAMSFQSTQRAEEIARDQAAMSQRVQELAQAVEEIARAAQAAGLDDSAFQNRLREVQELLRRELERSEELFKRAAIEGELASLAKDAEDLQRRQTEWTKQDAPHPDSAAAAAERELATAADSLARGVERAGQTVPLAQSQAAARRAQRAMQDAAARARQGAIEEGTHAIEQEIGAAAGRHALVSPQLEAALGYAQNQMKLAREQLEQGDPNPATAAPFAEHALDALNATAHALVRTAERVAGAKSGSGFQEALEQLARMAQQQQGMNGDAQGLLPMMGPGGDAVMQRLRELAGRQR